MTTRIDPVRVSRKCCWAGRARQDTHTHTHTHSQTDLRNRAATVGWSHWFFLDQQNILQGLISANTKGPVQTRFKTKKTRMPRILIAFNSLVCEVAKRLKMTLNKLMIIIITCCMLLQNMKQSICCCCCCCWSVPQALVPLLRLSWL